MKTMVGFPLKIRFAFSSFRFQRLLIIGVSCAMHANAFLEVGSLVPF